MTCKHIASEVHDAIDAEFARAHTKHKGFTPRSHSVSDLESLSILTEEVGEVARALNDGDDTEHLAAELIQVASVAASWAERLMVKGDA